MRSFDDRYRQLWQHHGDLLDGVIGIQEIVAALLLILLREYLIRSWPGVDPHLREEAADEAILQYLNEPDKVYAKSGSQVFGALAIWARCNLIDLHRREERREQTLKSWRDKVAADQAESPLRHIHESDDLDGLDWEKAIQDSVAARGFGLADLPFKDQAVIELMILGVKATEVYALVLGIEDQSPDMQQEKVRQAKARLRQWLKRHGLGHLLGKQ